MHIYTSYHNLITPHDLKGVSVFRETKGLNIRRSVPTWDNSPIYYMYHYKLYSIDKPSLKDLAIPFSGSSEMPLFLFFFLIGFPIL